MRDHFAREGWERNESRLFAIAVPASSSEGLDSLPRLSRKARRILTETAPDILAYVPDDRLHIPLVDMGWSTDISDTSYAELLRAISDRLYRPGHEPVTLRAGAPQVRSDSVTLALEDSADLRLISWTFAAGATEALGGGRPSEFDYYLPRFGPVEEWRRRRDSLPDPHTEYTTIDDKRRQRLTVAYGMSEDDSGAEFALLDDSPHSQGFLDPWDHATLYVDKIHLVDMRQDRAAGHYTWVVRDTMAVKHVRPTNLPAW